MSSIGSRRIVKYIAIITALSVTLTLIEGVFGCGEYAYAAKTKKPAKVKISQVKASGLKINVKWKKAKNAKKYQVYQKTGAGKWKLKKTLKKLNLTINGAYGQTYSFKVRGINGKKKGKFSAVKRITIPKKSTPADPGQEQGEKPVQPEEPEHEKTALEIAADKVTDKILAIPSRDEITEDDREVIEDARKAYNRLPETAKAFVKEETVRILEDAEKRLVELPAVAAAAIIDALPTPEILSEGYIERIQEAISAYTALSDEQKLLITDEQYDKLSRAVDRLQVLLTRQENRKAANKVSAIIMEYWDVDEVSYAERYKIKELRDAYEALSDEQKEFVDKEYTLSILEEAEAVIARKEALIQSYMVKWPKVTVSGIEFYKAIEEEDRVLLITTDVLKDENGENMKLYFGNSWVWRDSTLRTWLNETWLPKYQLLSDMVLETEITTVENELAEEKNYIKTNDRVFILSEADIKGGADIDDEYINGHSLLKGLEEEINTSESGETALVQDTLLPPTASRAWTRSPHNLKPGERVINQVMSYRSIHRTERLERFEQYKTNEVSSIGYFAEDGSYKGEPNCVQPVMWVDRAKLEQAAE